MRDPESSLGAQVPRVATAAESRLTERRRAHAIRGEAFRRPAGHSQLTSLTTAPFVGGRTQRLDFGQ